MIIFYTNSVSTKKDKQSIYDEIIRSIQDLGHKVISPEIQSYAELIDIEKAKKREKKISIHNQYIRKAIELSDAAVFEASNYSFKLGQEAQMALDKKVPVMCLADLRDYSQKVQDPYFYSAIYKSPEEVKPLLEDFFQEVKSKHLNKRINVFLHNKHINYLDWYVRTHEGSNRSEVLREALENAMQNDIDYNQR